MYRTENDIYFDWLLEFVSNRRNSSVISMNHLLLTILYNRPFLVHPNVLMDQNRLYDGLELRQRFLQETGKYRYHFISDECSILEMLIALSIRCEESIGNSIQNNTYKWFWEMMDNLGVKGTPDAEFINHMLDVFINREYNYDGSDGGIFIIKNPRKAMNETDLWYQAMWYLNRYL